MGEKDSNCLKSLIHLTLKTIFYSTTVSQGTENHDGCFVGSVPLTAGNSVGTWEGSDISQVPTISKSQARHSTLMTSLNPSKTLS